VHIPRDESGGVDPVEADLPIDRSHIPLDDPRGIDPE
jgi:hypothetical protein